MNTVSNVGLVFLAHVIAIIGSFILFMLWNNAEKIRSSKFWILGVAGYLFMVVQVGGAFSFLYAYYQAPILTEEIAVPIVFGCTLLACVIAFYINVYRPLRKIRKEMKEY